MKIPIKISPFFFVTAALIGWINSSQTSNPFILTLIWMGVIFISILVHEYGHALTSRYFGQKPRIQLVAFGGLTYPEGPRLRGWREFLVVLNGPVFGFLLFLCVSSSYRQVFLRTLISSIPLRFSLGSIFFGRLLTSFLSCLWMEDNSLGW